MDLTIDSLAYGGDGVARYEGKVVFVPFTAPGDRVRAIVEKETSSYLRARLVEVLEPSPQRRRPPCPLYEDCGGCQLQHVSYPLQRNAKRQFIEDALRRIAGLEEVSVTDCIPAAKPYASRHHARFSVQCTGHGPAVGFLARKSASIVPVASCLACHEAINRVLAIATQWLTEHGDAVCNPRKGRGWLCGLDVRTDENGTQATVCLEVTRRHGREMRSLAGHLMSHEAGIVGVCYRVAAHGPHSLARPAVSIEGASTLTCAVAGRRFSVHADAFFQGDVHTAERLVETVLSLAAPKEHETVADLYAGTGLFSIPLAERCKEVYAIESSEVAAECARENARLDGAKNVSVLATTAHEGLSLLREKGVQPDAVILDPPRGGLSPPTVKAMCRLEPSRIVYAGCDPATQARDIGSLVKQGYRLKVIQPIDMFPQTYHVESVALLDRVEE